MGNGIGDVGQHRVIPKTSANKVTPMPQHLHAVALVVPDYDTAISFYVEVLGFTLAQDTNLGDGKRWVLVTPKGGTTSLLLAKATTAQQTQAIGQQTGGRVSFFLHTDNFDADYADLHAKGLQFCETPRREPYGKVVVFQDPFGNRWDLLQLF